MEQWLQSRGNTCITMSAMPDVGGNVHSGFLAAWKDLAKGTTEFMQKNSPGNVRFTGHSRGGALALLAGAACAASNKDVKVEVCSLLTNSGI